MRSILDREVLPGCHPQSVIETAGVPPSSGEVWCGLSEYRCCYDWRDGQSCLSLMNMVMDSTPSPAIDFADLANTGVAPQTLSTLFEMIYPGTIRQVTNLPIDIRIERWIHREHPGLHAVQRTSLLAQLAENQRVLSPEIERHTPPTVYRASTAMNCAFAMAIAQLLDDPALDEAYRDMDIWEIGTELFEVIGAVPDDAKGDCTLVDRWAEILNVRGWYRWASLESLPPSQAVVSA